MSRFDKTLERVLSGESDANIRFDDLRSMLINLGFAERIRGSHHIFTRDDVAEILNLQSRGGKAKPYQVKQVRGILSVNRPSTAQHDESESPTNQTNGSSIEEDADDA